MKPFVHLHVHTEFSLLDGAARIKKLVKTCKEYGMPAVAITDHGNMFGAVEMFDTCKANGIKAIIGCEFYCCDDLYNKNGKTKLEHLILLAKNEEGYKNLCKLNSVAYVDGFYMKPRIDYKFLKEHSNGLICLSACLAGRIPQEILKNNIEEAEKWVLWFKDVFGEDFYLELQNHNLPEQIEVNKHLKDFSQRFGIKTVVTNDVHYIYKEDAILQDVLMCVNMGKFYDDTNRFRFPCDEFYLKTRDELLEAFPDDEEALDTTLEIADKCNFEFEYGHYKHPRYIPENGETPEEFLRKLIERGLKEKYGEVTPQIRERVEYEFGLITRQGFVEYFLTVWDYINAARNMGIAVGPGRGSGAGSVVAYAIGIVDTDPLKYDLLFERFINAERVSMPDFDVDFQDDRREDVLKYVEEKYGKPRFSKIVTQNKMAAKAAIKDVARVFRMAYSEVDKITKLMPEAYKRPSVIAKCFGFHHPKEGDKDYGTTYGVPELIEMYEQNPEIKRVVDIASKLEDTPRNVSTHACGMVIAPSRLDEIVPLARNGEDIVTQYNMIEIEHLGLLKFDFLGLRNLNDIQKAVQYVKENHGIDIDFHKMDYDDPEVFKMISNGDTIGVFQIESGGFQKFLKELKPTCLEDIIAAVSLYRPGPMDSIPKFVQNKHHPELTEYDHPLLEPILKVTYGCIVYQEQVMRIVQDLAGYTLGMADNIRRMMGKKQVEKMRAEKQVFIYGREGDESHKAVDGAIKRGVDAKTAELIWNKMEEFAKYAFNKSHAAAYSLITYQTAYLKCYYEPEFMTAILNDRITIADEIKNYINFAKSKKIKILPPDINLSEVYFSVKNGEIRFGLTALKGMGEGLCQKIIDERRKNGDFASMEDLLSRCCDFGINKKSIESLILGGALDCFGHHRSELLAVYSISLDRMAQDRKNRAAGQISFFDNILKDDTSMEIKYPKLPEMDNFTKLKNEKETIGIYLSGHPLDKHIDQMAAYSFNSSMIADDEEDDMSDDFEGEDENVELAKDYGIADGSRVTCGGLVNKVHRTMTKSSGKPMAIVTIEDLYGTYEVMFFPKIYETVKNDLAADKFVSIEGKFSARPGERPIIMAEKLSLWKEDSEDETKQLDAATADESFDEKKMQKLFLRFNLDDEFLKTNVFDVLDSYIGDTEVFVKSGATMFATKRKTSAKVGCLAELKSILGEENVVLK